MNPSDSRAAPEDALPLWDCPAPLREAVQRLAPLLYADLRRMAHRERARLVYSNTMETTALLHEAYLRLASEPGFESHEHFLRVAAITMRHLLIDQVRKQLARKRGGDLERVPLHEAEEEFEVADGGTVLEIHEALTRLAAFAPRQAEVVQCRYFAGYGDRETAAALGVTERTVQRDWVSARAWLARELGEKTINLPPP